VVVDISLTTKWTKFRNIRFLVEVDFIWCSVGKCAGGVAIFGVNNVVNNFSKQEYRKANIN
jgi:hypothetical protein